MNTEVILDVKNLETTFQLRSGPFRAVQNLSYQLKTGRTLGIVGESGCGKSVTSLSVMGLLEHPGKVTQGEVLFKNQDLLKSPDQQKEKFRGKSIAMIFQEPMTALNPVMTIGEQISEQILQHESLSPSEAWDRSVHMLDLVGIPSPLARSENYPHQLSGGMRQRAMIAMALSCNPEVLIADEPTTALDVTIQAQILELLQSLQEKMKMSVQFITHDLGVISEISDEVLVMYGGHLCETASAQEIFSHPRHPYTIALISSRPKIGQRTGRLLTIEGSVPAPSEMPKGCPFASRCSKAQPQCWQEKPVPTEISPGHKVACFFPEGARL